MKAKQGYLLMNTGAPSSTQEVDLQRYLKEVSQDHHVTNLPAGLDTAVHPRRASRTATAYKEIWTESGAPLIHTCKQIRNVLRERLDAPVELGMLYGDPSAIRAVGKLLDQLVEEICIVPMFPQYSVETFQACTDKVSRELRERKSRVIMRTVTPFYNQSDYFTPLAEKLAGTDEYVLFNYRGLSLHHLTKPDKHGHCLSSSTCCHESSAVHDTCYRFQCLKTTRLIAKEAGLADSQYSVAFDSRNGTSKCIEPYTEDVLRKLPEQNHRRLVVICPSHFCDSMETLEEVGIRGREIFLNAGGETLRMIPGMNDTKEGIQCMESLMRT